MDLQAGHVLPASRFKMSRLWKSNLVNQCAVCNLKLGANIRWSLQAVKLLSIYMIIKAIKFISLALLIVILGRYAYLDINNNGSTLTDQMMFELMEYYQKLKHLS